MAKELLGGQIAERLMRADDAIDLFPTPQFTILPIEFGQPSESSSKAITSAALGNAFLFFEENFLKAFAALLGVMATAVVNQDAAHQWCGNAQEQLAVSPAGLLFDLGTVRSGN